MRAVVSDYQCVAPESLAQALELLSESADWKVLAGGTDLMVPYSQGRLKEKRLLSLHRCQELKAITVTDDVIEIGALVSCEELAQNLLVQQHVPLLLRSARETGAQAIQCRATLAGNIVNASPAADNPPALLAYDARLVLRSRDSQRELAYRDFHQGYKVMDLRPDELLTAIRIPVREYLFEDYEKVGTRASQAISKVCCCLTVDADQRVRIGLGSVAPYPARAYHLEKLLEQQGPLDLKDVAEALEKDIQPIDDIRSEADYRFQVCANVLYSMWQAASKTL